MSKKAAKPKKKTARDRSKARLLNDRKRQDRYKKIAMDWARLAHLTLRHIGNDDYDGDWTFNAIVPEAKREDVAIFATHAPIRWYIRAVAVYRTDSGDEYRHEGEFECGQPLMIDELRGHREQMMEQCRLGNKNHAWDEYFEMKAL